MVLYRHWFCSLNSSAKELFASTLLLGPRPQIWELYSIVGLTTAVYNRHVSQNKNPHIKATICDVAENAAAFLWVIYVMCLFQFSLESTHILRILKVVSGFALYP